MAKKETRPKNKDELKGISRNIARSFDMKADKTPHPHPRSGDGPLKLGKYDPKK